MRAFLFLLLCCVAARVVAAPPTVLVLGDSLSAAHNIPIDAGWPHLLDVRLAAMAPPRRLVNASISGETTTSGRGRLPALLRQYQPQVVILELGANDGLQGMPLQQIRANLAAMVAACRDTGAKVLLLGIELPVNYGPRYRDGLRAIYADLAGKYHTGLVPFLLQGVALKPALMQADGMHPTAAGERIVFDNVWSALAPMLDTKSSSSDRRAQRSEHVVAPKHIGTTRKIVLRIPYPFALSAAAVWPRSRSAPPWSFDFGASRLRSGRTEITLTGAAM